MDLRASAYEWRKASAGHNCRNEDCAYARIKGPSCLINCYVYWFRRNYRIHQNFAKRDITIRQFVQDSRFPPSPRCCPWWVTLNTRTPHSRRLCLDATHKLTSSTNSEVRNYTMGPKSGTTYSWPEFSQTWTDFQKKITARFLGKFAVKYINNPTATCICCYTTLWNIDVSKTSH